MLAISQPDVFKSLVSDTYIVFGEGQSEDASSLQSQLQAAEDVLKDADETPETSATSPDATPDEDDEEVDDEGVNKGDIELVMTQANVSRAKAVKALKAHDNDIVNAIMVGSSQSVRCERIDSIAVRNDANITPSVMLEFAYCRNSLCKDSLQSRTSSLLLYPNRGMFLLGEVRNKKKLFAQTGSAVADKSLACAWVVHFPLILPDHNVTHRHIGSKLRGVQEPMASTRFKGLIATQLAKLTGGDASVIARAIERPKIRGHGTFAISIPRLFPSSDAQKKKRKGTGMDTNTSDTNTALLARIQLEVLIYRI